MKDYGSQALEQQARIFGASTSRETYRMQLVAQKQQHDERGAALARALEILDKHPEIEELLTIVGRGL